MTTLSEAASKELLGGYGVPFADRADRGHGRRGGGRRRRAGLPGGGQAQRGRASPTRPSGVSCGWACATPAPCGPPPRSCWPRPRPEDGPVQVLVAPMLRGSRELIAGLSEDPQFGMTVMLGVGGILAEAVADVSVRLVPIDPVDAEDMIDDLATQPLLGPFRGEPAVDRLALVDVLVALSAGGGRRAAPSAPPTSTRSSWSTAGPSPSTPSWRCGDGRRTGDHPGGPVPGAVRAPRASSSPAPRPIRASSGSSPCTTSSPPATTGRSTPPTARATRCSACPACRTSRTCPRAPPTSSSCARRRRATPSCCAWRPRRGSARRSSRRPATARRGSEGRRAQEELAALADDLGMLIVGPNGQGVVSTPVEPVRPDRGARTRRGGASAS